MKKFSILALVLVLTLSVFTACRGPMEDPTEMTTLPATVPTRAPETQPTVPQTTEGMMDPQDTLESTGTSDEPGQNGGIGEGTNGAQDEASGGMPGGSGGMPGGSGGNMDGSTGDQGSRAR